MPDHPAKDFLLASLSFNLVQLKDLEFLLELAGSMTDTQSEWHKRAQHYRAIVANRIAQMEAELNA